MTSLTFKSGEFVTDLLEISLRLKEGLSDCIFVMLLELAPLNVALTLTDEVSNPEPCRAGIDAKVVRTSLRERVAESLVT